MIQCVALKLEERLIALNFVMNSSLWACIKTVPNAKCCEKKEINGKNVKLFLEPGFFPKKGYIVIEMERKFSGMLFDEPIFFDEALNTYQNCN
ncbi:hypothetical protein [Aliivibrio salmonicida]|uniref:hypothetical protein n=2 Tax=Aliivibrio salmonicida TaxID=40269 RepID=UPI0030A13E77